MPTSPERPQRHEAPRIPPRRRLSRCTARTIWEPWPIDVPQRPPREVRPPLDAAGTLGADLLDISEGGMQCAIELSATLEVGAQIVGAQIQADLELDGSRCTLGVRVARRARGDKRDRVGLEFEGLAEDQRDVVLGYISRLIAAEDES